MHQSLYFEYEGGYIGGKKHGHGIIRFLDGETHEGTFFMGELIHSTSKFPNGWTWIGAIKNCRPYRGKWTHSSGKVIKINSKRKLNVANFKPNKHQK